MFSIRCNICFMTRNAQDQFHLNRCYHVICNRCKSKFSDGNKCPLCKQPTKGIAINSDMPSSVANYFQDPNVFLKVYRSISKFQSEQHALYFKHFYEQQKSREIKKEKLQGYLKLEAHLRQQIETEKKRIAELRNYAAYYEQHDGVNTTNSSSSEISRISRKKRPPRTPAFSTSELSLSDNDGEGRSCLKEINERVSSERATPITMKDKNSSKEKDDFHVNF